MLIEEYEKFVRESDWTRNKDLSERVRVARYGLAAEVGSLAATIKKKVLHDSSDNWNAKNEEIVEELGDCLWYATQLSTLSGKGGLAEVVAADLSALPKEIDKNPKFREALDANDYATFRVEAPKVIALGGKSALSNYQNVAILTARTRGMDLLDVCVTRLLLYATSVMSRQFPEAEYHLKNDILQFSEDRTLGMLLWHISAIAKVYDISLDIVASTNRRKMECISNLSNAAPTDLYDRNRGVPDGQQFPAKFRVSYLSTDPGRLQMYYRGRPLGDELDDNAKIEDGYRFHDALHLANAGILGWSPVLRSLMGLKRKYDPAIDGAEDGARARIVEEAIVKAVHSEAIRVARLEGLKIEEARKRLFSDPNQIQYQFLKMIKVFAEGLEVHQSEIWEWKQAIVAGHGLYVQLHAEGQGTVTVDLENRKVSFSPLVIADLHGPVVDSAIEICQGSTGSNLGLEEAEQKLAEVKAILRILDLDPAPSNLELVRIAYDIGRNISVKTHGAAQREMWTRGILGFRAKWTKINESWVGMVMAIGSP